MPTRLRPRRAFVVLLTCFLVRLYCCFWRPKRAMNVTTMTMTTEKQTSDSGFAAPLKNDTYLGLAC